MCPVIAYWNNCKMSFLEMPLVLHETFCSGIQLPGVLMLVLPFHFFHDEANLYLKLMFCILMN